MDFPIEVVISTRSLDGLFEVVAGIHLWCVFLGVELKTQVDQTISLSL